MKYILGIETSCDETAAAVLNEQGVVMANLISSQIELHSLYGGVVPEIAARRHLEVLPFLVDEALAAAGIRPEDISLIAVTCGPGLIGGLLVGLSFAKGMALGLGVDLIGVNHIEGHICAGFIEQEVEPPLICLTVSGGHTALLVMDKIGSYKVLGRTQDDAAGETLDKVARVLGLPYPGGPHLEERAACGNAGAYPFPVVHTDNPYDFSFSGLKTAAINLLHRLNQTRQPFSSADFAASFQGAVIKTLVDKTVEAIRTTGVKKLLLTGGVVANRELKSRFQKASEARNFSLYYPSPVYCTDNAAMIAKAGFLSYHTGRRSDFSLRAEPGLSL